MSNNFFHLSHILKIPRKEAFMGNDNRIVRAITGVTCVMVLAKALFSNA